MIRFITSLFIVLAASAVQSYEVRSGTNGYVTYQVGGANTKIILSAGHGGTLRPGTIPCRPQNGCYNADDEECIYTTECSANDDKNKCGVKSTYSDENTQLLANELADALKAKIGGATPTDADRPHVIRCELHRSKVDVNRDLGQAAFEKEDASVVWKEYHELIDEAKANVTASGSRALYVDLHGQSISEYNMIGFLLPAEGRNGLGKSALPDRLAQYSSIMQLHVDSGVSMEELVRGNTSIGGLMEPDFKMIPAPDMKNAGDTYYYAGGYSLRRHTGWEISGFQVEASREIRRDTAQRQLFADKLADAIICWLKMLSGNVCV